MAPMTFVSTKENPEEPGPRDALVAVPRLRNLRQRCRIRKTGRGRGPRPPNPTPIGHELSGVILKVGAEVRDLAPGTRVVLNPMGGGNQIGNGGQQGGFTPELLVPNVAAGGVLFPIPDDLSDEQAALAEPLGVGMQSVNRAGLQPGEKAVIFGAGPIGLMALATCRYRGIEDVVVVDLSEKRLSLAREMGAPGHAESGRRESSGRSCPPFTARAAG